MEAGFETATTVEAGYNYPETDRFGLKRVTARHKRPRLAAWIGAARGIFGQGG